MTVRSRRSTQEGTGVYDPERKRALFGTPPAGGSASTPATRADGWELDATEVAPGPTPAVEQATPTRIDTPVPSSASPSVPPAASPADQATPTAVTARLERSEPIRVISMKEPSAGRPRVEEPRVPLHVQLRTMAEVAGRRIPPSGLGRLAPPRDPRQARKRRQLDNVVWACVAVGLAGGIALVIWLIAGR
jgi:hypothetical protein